MSKRGRLIILNSSTGIVNEIISILCGLILPRLILGAFGSKYNGITSSISQFLGFITIVRSGIGGVSKVYLYKYLADKNQSGINTLMKTIQSFMQKVSIIFVGGLVLIAGLYPFSVLSEFDFTFTSTLVLIIGVSAFFENLFGFSSRILLQADQKEYISTFIDIISTILNTLLAAILVKCDYSIHIVKLGSAMIFTLKPIILSLYVKRHYKINFSGVKRDNSLIQQRWDAMAHTLAEFFHLNTDLVILSVFTSTLEVSVYTVYSLLVNGLRKFLVSVTSNIEASLGSLKVHNDKIAFKTFFQTFEYIIFAISAVLFSCSAVLAEPFVMIYTKGITDVNYSRVFFAVVIAIAEMFYSIRLPYQFVIRVFGKFKETKIFAILEAVINITLSVIFVQFWGIVGVAIGTLVAMMFRTVVYCIFSLNKILDYGMISVFKGLSLNIFTFLILYGFDRFFRFIIIDSYKTWVIYAFAVFFTSVVIVIVLSFIFFNSQLKGISGKITGKLK